MSVTTESSADAVAIRPFRVEIPEQALDDLRRRIAATRWPWSRVWQGRRGIVGRTGGSA